MNPQIQMLERADSIPEPLPEQLVFTGGSTIGLYLDEVA